jgi:hypothetical protein
MTTASPEPELPSDAEYAAANRAALQRDLRTALEGLKQALRTRRDVGRREVRAILLPLGALLSETEADDSARWLGEVCEIAALGGQRWKDALESELQLAATEYIQAVDPRYLGVPGYDFAYTLDSRERLEVRRVAARALSYELPQATLLQIESADEQLEAELHRRGGDEPES